MELGKYRSGSIKVGEKGKDINGTLLRYKQVIENEQKEYFSVLLNRDDDRK